MPSFYWCNCPPSLSHKCPLTLSPNQNTFGIYAGVSISQTAFLYSSLFLPSFLSLSLSNKCLLPFTLPFIFRLSSPFISTCFLELGKAESHRLVGTERWWKCPRLCKPDLFYSSSHEQRATYFKGSQVQVVRKLEPEHLSFLANMY